MGDSALGSSSLFAPAFSLPLLTRTFPPMRPARAALQKKMPKPPNVESVSEAELQGVDFLLGQMDAPLLQRKRERQELLKAKEEQKQEPKQEEQGVVKSEPRDVRSSHAASVKVEEDLDFEGKVVAGAAKRLTRKQRQRQREKRLKKLRKQRQQKKQQRASHMA